MCYTVNEEDCGSCLQRDPHFAALFRGHRRISSLSVLSSSHGIQIDLILCQVLIDVFPKLPRSSWPSEVLS